MDDRGYLEITDRKKDMFIVGRFNVYPGRSILEYPDVAQVAVVSAPDPRMGEVGRSSFPTPASIDPDELCVVRPHGELQGAPRHVVDALPVDASGKVLKFELREGLTMEARHTSTRAIVTGGFRHQPRRSAAGRRRCGRRLPRREGPRRHRDRDRGRRRPGLGLRVTSPTLARWRAASTSRSWSSAA